MSNSMRPTATDSSPSNKNHPPAIIHKKVFEVAEEDPDATIPQIASRVSGASISLVERVLDEYENNESTHSSGGTDRSASSETNKTDSYPTIDDLTFKQKQTLKEIHKRPNATQGELAEHFEVDRTSVSHRLNNIPGFRWQNRHKFVRTLFDEDRSVNESRKNSSHHDSDSTDEISLEELTEQLAIEFAGESQIDDSTNSTSRTELVYKILCACFEYEGMSTEDEIEVVRKLMTQEEE